MRLIPLKFILFFLAVAIYVAIPAKAGQLQHNIQIADTIIRKDSVPIPDPKKGFSNLFINNTLGNGVSPKQLNPQAVSFVQDYVLRHSRSLKKMKDWGRPYFDMMDAILTGQGLPKELKYLAVIESHLKSSSISWAGAVGPWQFMPGTARSYGLKVTPQLDERTDYLKSTHAASRLLKDLFEQYGDWLLVIAAYNGGPGNVDRAIRASGTRDFWTLQNKLPNETKDHVKKFISTHYIMEGESGITTLTKKEMKEVQANYPGGLSKEEFENAKTLTVGGKYNATVIAGHLGMDLVGFNRYNPGFNSLSAAKGSYEMRLPPDKMEIFLAKKNEILDESIQLLLKQAH